MHVIVSITILFLYKDHLSSTWNDNVIWFISSISVLLLWTVWYLKRILAIIYGAHSSSLCEVQPCHLVARKGWVPCASRSHDHRFETLAADAYAWNFGIKKKKKLLLFLFSEDKGPWSYANGWTQKGCSSIHWAMSLRKVGVIVTFLLFHVPSNRWIIGPYCSIHT